MTTYRVHGIIIVNKRTR